MQRLFHDAKRAYGKRSKVVHGEYEGVREQEFEGLVHQAEDWLLTRSLFRILRGDPDYRETFSNSKRRDEFMDRLILGLEDDTGAAGAQ